MAKTILITGASSGFGKEAALLFHRNGWNVIATMRSPEKETTLTNIENVLTVRLDVNDADSITSAISSGINHFGSIDVLLNSAGYGLFGVFESATAAQIQQQFQVNVFGLMHVTQAVLPYFRQQQSGTVINISSFGGITGSAFASLYNSSKFAVEGLSEALWYELAFLNIGVKIIEPGSVATNFRSGMTMVQNSIETYNQHMAAFMPKFAARTAALNKATTADVAAAIYKAATDGTEQLRYVVGEDAQYYIDLKTKQSEVALRTAMRG